MKFRTEGVFHFNIMISSTDYKVYAITKRSPKTGSFVNTSGGRVYATN